MSTPSETILITVDIVSNEKQLQSLLVKLAEVKASQQGLSKANAEGKLSNDDLAAATVRYKAETAAITSEIKVLTKANLDQIAVNKAAAGSVDELKAKSALLTTQVNALGEAERKTAGGQELVKSLKQTNDALIAAGKNVSDGRRSVGLYSEALKEAGLGAKDFHGGLTSAVTQGLSPFRNEMERGSGVLSRFRSGTDLLKTGLSSLKSGGETGALGFKAIGAGIALSGLGLLLIVLSTVYTYFTNTAEGGKLLKQALAGVGAVVTVLTNGVASFGKTIVEAFSHPLDTIRKIGDTIQENLINRITAFAVVFQALKSGDTRKLADGFIQMGTGIANGTEKAKALAKGLENVASQAVNAAHSAAAIEKELQRLVPVRRAQEKDEKEQTGRVEVLLRLSRDQNLSHQERKKSLEEAGVIEKKLSEDSIDLNTRELVLLERKLALENGGKETGQIKADIQEKELAIIDLKNNRESTYAKIRVRESGQDSAMRAEALADKKAKAAEAIKLEEDGIKRRITATKLELINTTAGSQQELRLRERVISQQAELEAAGEKKRAADRALIRANSLMEIEKLENDFQQKQEEKAAKFLQDGDNQRIKALAYAKKKQDDDSHETEERYKGEQGFLERHLARLRADIEKNYAAGLLDKKQYDAQIERLDNTGFGARIILAKQYGKDTSRLEEQQAKEHSASVSKLTDAEKKAYAERTKAAQQFGQEIGSLFAQTLTDTGASMEQFSAKVLILILDEMEKYILAQEAKAFARAVATSGPLGIIEAAAEAALITAAFEGAKALISRSPTKQFATGGIIEGPSHAQGGVPFSVGGRLGFEAEGGEVIISRKAAEMPGAMAFLSHLNSLGGGVAFASGGLVPGALPRPVPMADGGFVARQMGTQAPIIDYQALAQALSSVTVEANFVSFDKGRVRHDKPRNMSTLGG